jgi:hypothetical protein
VLGYTSGDAVTMRGNVIRGPWGVAPGRSRRPTVDFGGSDPARVWGFRSARAKESILKGNTHVQDLA